MAGNHNSGRKPLDDPKAKTSVRIRRSTLMTIQEIAYEQGIPESLVIQTAVDQLVESLRVILQKRPSQK